MRLSAVSLLSGRPPLTTDMASAAQRIADVQAARNNLEIIEVLSCIYGSEGWVHGHIMVAHSSFFRGCQRWPTTKQNGKAAC